MKEFDKPVPKSNGYPKDAVFVKDIWKFHKSRDVLDAASDEKQKQEHMTEEERERHDRAEERRRECGMRD